MTATLAGHIDPVAILQELGIEPDGECRRVVGGWATAIWRFKTADGKRHSLRLFNPGSQGMARREALAMSCAVRAGLPAPEVEIEGTWEGRPVMVLSWLPGVSLLEAASKRPWRIWRLGAQMGSLQARIHAVSPADELKEDAPERWLGRMGADYNEMRYLVYAFS
jgi:hypothetical protein